MVERHGIAWHEKELGQLFCDESSKQIVRCCSTNAPPPACGSRPAARRRVRHATAASCVDTALGRRVAPALVVATGGLSIPSMGATGFGYALARQFGHAVLPTRAGLVPLTLSGKHLERCRTSAAWRCR
jgi:predicted flavoprotein YhiN